MLLVSGHVRVPEGTLEHIRPAVRAMVEASRAEDGCIDYALSVDTLDPTLIRIVERWRDRAALAAHFQTPHMAEWNRVLAGLQLIDRELFMMEGPQLAFSL